MDEIAEPDLADFANLVSNSLQNRPCSPQIDRWSHHRPNPPVLTDIPVHAQKLSCRATKRMLTPEELSGRRPTVP